MLPSVSLPCTSGLRSLRSLILFLLQDGIRCRRTALLAQPKLYGQRHKFDSLYAFCRHMPVPIKFRSLMGSEVGGVNDSDQEIGLARNSRPVI